MLQTNSVADSYRLLRQEESKMSLYVVARLVLIYLAVQESAFAVQMFPLKLLKAILGVL